MFDVSAVDKNMAVVSTIDNAEYKMLNVKDEPFSVHGLILESREDQFRRMPRSVAECINKGIKQLHKDTAGGRVCFRTDSSQVAISVKLPPRAMTTRMTWLVTAGFDIYEVSEGAYIYKGAYVPPAQCDGGFASVIGLGDRKMRDLVIHFPCYSAVLDLQIGIEPDATVEHSDPYGEKAPFICYGSSITQGACASRPGNAYSNILSRKLGIDHINLGFSGSCKGEMEMAAYIASQPMSLFLYDYDHNAPDAEHLAKTHEAFFLHIREKHPDLPILIASRTDYATVDEDTVQTDKRRAVIEKTYENALRRGDREVAFIDGGAIPEKARELGLDPDICTVDSVHPNDVGFAFMASVFAQEITKLLKRSS